MLLKKIDRVTIISLLILCSFCFGILFPETWWTTHFISFLPNFLKYGIILLSGILILFPVNLNSKIDLSSTTLIGAISLLFGIITYHYPIVFDNYGDSYKFTDFLNNVPDKIPEKAAQAIFSFKVGTTAGQDSVLGIVTSIAYLGKITYYEAFKLLDTFSGALFIFVWLFFSKRYFTENKSRIIFLLAVLTTPLLLNFFGHQEIYAPSFALYSIWIAYLILSFQKKSITGLVVLIIIWLACLKLHSAAILLLPALILAIVYHLMENTSIKSKLFHLKNLLILIVVPAVIAGIVGYFFIFKDYNDPRNLDQYVQGNERLFLPLFSPPAPLDKYNLFSLNHLFDFITLPFLWSPLAIMALFSINKNQRKKINLQEPVLLLILITFILFLLLFFAINPLLSMPLDWDLYSFPTLLLIALTSIIIKQLELENINLIDRWLNGSPSIVLLSLPFFIIHFSGKMLSERYEAIGKRIYFSYYEWSAKTIEFSLGKGYTNLNDRSDRRESIINELRPFALKGKDREYTNLLINQSKYLLRNKHEPDEALNYLFEADLYYSKNNLIPLYKMESFFIKKQFKKALEESSELVKLKYPNEQKALSIAINCAVEAKEYAIAEKYCLEYLNKWEDPVIESVLYRINNNMDLEHLGELFAK